MGKKDSAGIIALFFRGAPKNIRRIAILGIGMGVLIFALGRIAPAGGLTGRYFANSGWEGEPAATSLDPRIHFDKEDIVKKTESYDRSSVWWQGCLFIRQAGLYRFSIVSDDGSWIYVDSNLLVDNGEVHPQRSRGKEIFLERGNHEIEIKYFDAGGRAQVDFYAKRSGRLQFLKPTAFLYPKPADSGTVARSAAVAYLSLFLKAVLAILALAFALLVPQTISPAFRKYAAFEEKALTRAAGFLKLKPAGRSSKFIPALAVGLFLILGGLYEIQVFAKKSTAVFGCDSYSYLQGAELMARNGFFRTEYVDPLIPQIYRGFKTPPPENDLVFFLSPHGYHVHDLNTGTVYNIFPPGMSMLLFPFVKIGGWKAAFYVLPILNGLLLALVFMLALKYVDVVFALGMSAFAFFNAHVFINTVVLMSDVPAMAFLALSAFFLYRNIKSPRLAWAFAAGASFGVSVAIRYANVAGVLPLLVLLWSRRRAAGRAYFKEIAAFVLGGLVIGALPLAVYTHRLYGEFFRSVYEPTTQSVASWVNLGPGLRYYARSLVETFGIPGLLLMAVGLGACLARSRRRAAGIVGLLGFLGFFAFYSVQSMRDNRYLLPAYPFLALFAGFGLIEILRAFRRSRILALLIIVFFAIYPLAHSWNAFPVGHRDGETISAELKKAISPKAVVFCDEYSGPLRLYDEIPSYRMNWTKNETLIETLATLHDLEYDLYFLLDSQAAKDKFDSLKNQLPLIEELAKSIGPIQNIPLYRIAAGEPGGR
jgi:hypothetical protein